MFFLIVISLVVYLIIVLAKGAKKSRGVYENSSTSTEIDWSHHSSDSSNTQQEIKEITHRGTYSERLIVNTLRNVIANPQTIFHDVYFKKTHNFFVQVDIIVPTRVGILIFEVKDYNGWIYGNGMQPTWTQVLAYGKHKYHFYNPIMQNQEHIRHVKSMCHQLERIPFFSIVVFTDNCQLQDIKDLPENTFLVYDYQVEVVVRSILNNNEPAPYTDKMEVMRLFATARENGANPYVVEWHSRKTSEMHDGRNR